jgi:hypothetical protein
MWEHAMARSTPDLENAKRNIEQILTAQKEGPAKVPMAASNGLGGSASNDLSTAILEVHRLTDLCNITATDIQKTGEDVTQIANGLAAETAALAELLRKHGASISNRIEEFTVMTKRISDLMRDVRADVLSASKLSGPRSAASS